MISVVVAIYKEPIDEVVDCVRPLLAHEGVPLEILVLDQCGRPDIENALSRIPVSSTASMRVERIPDRSLSYARNIGLQSAKGDVVAFLDPDAVPSAGWAASVQAFFEQRPRPALMAGRIFPLHAATPNLLNRSALVVEQQSTLDLGDGALDVDRAIGANFAVDRHQVDDLRFEEALGRRDGLLLGGEETEFCRRLLDRGLRIVYWPGAAVHHRVPRSRMSVRWLSRRFYYGGVSRGLRGGAPSPITRRRRWADVMALAVLGPPYVLGLVRGRRMRRQSGRESA